MSSGVTMSSEHGPALLAVTDPDENRPVSGPQIHDAARGGRGVVLLHGTADDPSRQEGGDAL